MSATRLNLERHALQEYSELDVLVISPDTSLSGAIALMNQHRSSCLLIESQHKLEGIFTERDLVKSISRDIDYADKTISEVMTKQPVALQNFDYLSPLELIDVFKQHQIRHLPLIDALGKAVGVITHNSLRKTIQDSYLLRQKKVKEIMNHEVVWTTGDRNIVEIALLLTNHRVSCVVIVENYPAKKLVPVGIVTERDLVQFKALNLDLTRHSAGEVMSSPLFPIHQDLSLRDAHKLMFSRHIRRLVVTDDNGFLAGIVTQTSILSSLNLQEVSETIDYLKDLVKQQTKKLNIEREIEIKQKQELERNKLYLRGILANIEKIVIIVDLQNDRISVISDSLNNSDRLKDALVEPTRHLFCQPKTRQAFLNRVRQAIQTRQKVDFSYSIDLPNKGQFKFVAQIHSLADNSAICIARNITQSQKRQIDLQNENRELKQKIAQSDRELAAANRLMRQQIADFFNFSTAHNKNARYSWLQPLLPRNNKLGTLLAKIQRRNYPVWTGAAITLAIALIIESYRRAGIVVPVPFMLLIISVSASAGLGGVLAGLLSHLVWSLCVVYAAIIGFGPQTLTGGSIQVTAGIGVMAIFAVIQGWTKEQNRWLTDILENRNNRLEHEIGLRTKDLETININLRTEIQERIAIQKALVESEQKFRTIFEQAQVGIVVSGLNKKLLQVNPKFCQFIGYDAQELQTMTFEQISHPDEKQSDRHHVRQMRNSKFDHLVKEKRYIHKDGSVIWGNLTAKTVKNAKNQPHYFIAIIQDITRSKQAELALQENEKSFLLLLNSCPFLIWTSGVNGLCDFFNTAWLDFTGKTLEQELDLGWCEGVHPEDLDFCLHTYETAFARRERFKMEYRLRRRNGKYSWVLDEGIPRFKADGSFAGYIGTCIDISDRIQAKQEIERERQFLKSILQQMPAGVVIAEPPSGKIILSNQRAADIIRFSQLPSIHKIEDYDSIKTWHSDGTPKKSSDFALLKALKGETSSGEEVDVLCGDRIRRTLLVNAAPIRKEKSNIIAAIATFSDITELKQAQALKRDAENKSTLLKEIHHRIKNNLQIVSALLDLQSEQIKDKNAIVLLEKSQARIQTMALIHEKLYSSKNLDKVDFVEYITSLTNYLRDSFVRDFQKIKLVLEIEPTYLSLDLATPCGLIVNELIVNSLEHGFINRETGEIKIMFFRQNGSYYLTVKDNGWGISEQVDLVNDTQFLGLSLVSSLVEKQLKGEWKIQKNSGCVIQITFPSI